MTPLPKLLYNTTSPRVNGHSLRRGWRCDLTSLRDRLAVVFLFLLHFFAQDRDYTWFDVWEMKDNEYDYDV